MALDNELLNRLTLIEDQLSGLSSVKQTSSKPFSLDAIKAEFNGSFRRLEGSIARVNSVATKAERKANEAQGSTTNILQQILQEAPITIEYVEGLIEINDSDPFTQLLTLSDFYFLLTNGKELEITGPHLIKLDLDVFVPQVVFLDIAKKSFNVVDQAGWQSDRIYRDKTKYGILFLVDSKYNADSQKFPKIEFLWPPYMDKVFKTDDELKEQDELVTFLRNTVISITKDHLLDDVSVINLDPEFPLRVDLPAGSHLLLVSGKYGKEIETARPAKVGALEIDIRPQFLTLEKGAKILFDNAYYQAQLFVQPNRVLITANEAKTEAEAAVRLINDQSRTVAELFTEVYGNNNTQYAGIKAEIDRIKNNSSLVLKTDTNGIVSAINLFSGESSEINFQAKNFTFEGNANFTSAINQAIINNELNLPQIKIFKQPSTNLPTNPNTGDRWYQTDKGNLLFTFDANISENGDWIRSFTNIDEGFLTTGILSAQYLNIDKKLTIPSGGSFVLGNEQAGNYSIIDIAGMRSYKENELMVNIPSNGGPSEYSGNLKDTKIVGNMDITDGYIKLCEDANGNVSIINNAQIQLYQSLPFGDYSILLQPFNTIFFGPNNSGLWISPTGMFFNRGDGSSSTSINISAYSSTIEADKLISRKAFNGTIPSGSNIVIERGIVMGYN